MSYLWLLLLIPVVLVAEVLVRTARFKPGAAPQIPEGEEVFDRDKAVENLRTLIRFKTVSNTDPQKEDDAEFQKLIDRTSLKAASLSGCPTAGCCLPGRANSTASRAC